MIETDNVSLIITTEGQDNFETNPNHQLSSKCKNLNCLFFSSDFWQGWEEWRAVVENIENNWLWSGAGGQPYHQDLSSWNICMDGPRGHQDIDFQQGLRRLEVDKV